MRARHVGAVGRRVFRPDPAGPALHRALPAWCLVIVALLKLVLDAWPALKLVGVDAGENALPAGAFIIFFVAYVLAAIALVRERTGAGTLERMLVATFRRGEIVLGYVLGFAALAFVQATLVVATIAVLLYDRSAPGLPDCRWCWPWCSCSALASIGLGLLVSSTARSEGQIFPFTSGRDRAQPSPVGAVDPVRRALAPAAGARPARASHLCGGCLGTGLPRWPAGGGPPRLPGALLGALRRRAGRRGQPHPEGA